MAKPETREELIERLTALEAVFEIRSSDLRLRMSVRIQYDEWSKLIHSAVEELEKKR